MSSADNVLAGRVIRDEERMRNGTSIALNGKGVEDRLLIMHPRKV